MSNKGLYRKINSNKLRKRWVKICKFDCSPMKHITTKPEIYDKLLPGVEYALRSYNSVSNEIKIFQSELGFKLMVSTVKNGLTTSYLIHDNTISVIDIYNPRNIIEVNDVKEIESILYDPSVV